MSSNPFKRIFFRFSIHFQQSVDVSKTDLCCHQCFCSSQLWGEGGVCPWEGGLPASMTIVQRVRGGSCSLGNIGYTTIALKYNWQILKNTFLYEVGLSCFENKVATFLFPLFPPKTCNCPRKNIHRSNFLTVFSCFRLACDFNIANFCPFSIFVPGEIVALFLTGQGEGAIVLKIHKNRAFVGSGVNFVYLGPLQSQMLFSGVVNC